MQFVWSLILYIHATGTVLPIAQYGPDKVDCDKMAASFNAGKDTGVQTFVCVPQAAPAAIEPPARKPAAGTTPAPVSDDFLRGAALGYVVGASKP